MEYIIFVLLSIVCVIDIKQMIIPDSLNIILGLIGTYLIIRNLTNVADRLIGLLIGFSLFMLIALLTNDMGGGDIKLMAACGLIFGIKGVLFITLFSFITGAIISVLLLLFKIKNRKDKIPFGPFISLSAMLYMCCGDKIISWYMGLFI